MMTVNPRTRTAGVSHGGATKRRLLGVPVRSIVAWELFSRAAVAIVTWLRGLLPSGARSVSGRWCVDALARKSYACQDVHEKSDPEGPLFMSATWTANGPTGLSPSDDPQAGRVAVFRFGNGWLQRCSRSAPPIPLDPCPEG